MIMVMSILNILSNYLNMQLKIMNLMKDVMIISYTLEEIKKIGFDFDTNENCEYIQDNDINDKIDITLINKIDKNGNETIINNVDFESDKIVNTKRVRIDFKVDNTNKEIIKYYDYVILNYLEQVLPSTLIVEINYVKSF